MKIPNIAFILLLFTSSFISAQELDLHSFFNKNDLKRVKDGEIITRMYLKNDVKNENTDISINVPKTDYTNEDSSIYEMISDEKAFIPYEINSEKDKLTFYNTLTAYSKLSGMKYHSRRVNKVKELIVESYKIESPKIRKKLEDTEYDSINSKEINYFLQEDNKFGKLIFRSEVFNNNNDFVLINTCVLPVKKLIFSVSNKEEYKFISYFIYDEKMKGFYYYTVNLMRIRLKILLDKNSKYALHPTTFSNRLRAGTVKLGILLGLDWADKINPWIEKLLLKDHYKNY